MSRHDSAECDIFQLLKLKLKLIMPNVKKITENAINGNKQNIIKK